MVCLMMTTVNVREDLDGKVENVFVVFGKAVLSAGPVAVNRLSTLRTRETESSLHGSLFLSAFSQFPWY